MSWSGAAGGNVCFVCLPLGHDDLGERQSGGVLLLVVFAVERVLFPDDQGLFCFGRGEQGWARISHSKLRWSRVVLQVFCQCFVSNLGAIRRGVKSVLLCPPPPPTFRRHFMLCITCDFFKEGREKM